mgnify:CR=1 FL=1
MIRSTSKAIFYMAQNRNLQPKNFNIEMYLRFNLGPLHHSDGLIKEILAFDSKKTYIMTGTIASRMASKEVGKSSAISTFEEKDETKSRLPDSFWTPSTSKLTK